MKLSSFPHFDVGQRLQVTGDRVQQAGLFALSPVTCTVGVLPMAERNLALIGFMGTGKTTVGQLCAARLEYDFYDSDTVVEARAGCTIARFFAERGEAAFRQLEREVIAELAAIPG